MAVPVDRLELTRPFVLAPHSSKDPFLDASSRLPRTDFAASLT